MSETDIETTVCRCLAAYDKAKKAKAAAEELLGSFRTSLIASVVEAIEKYNLEGDGPYVYVEHKTDVRAVEANDRFLIEVTVTLGYFRARSGGWTVGPREAWERNEDQLVGDLCRHLEASLGLPPQCRIRVHPPDDYDMMSADPDL